MFRSIVGRLTFWFLVISLIPCGVLTLVLYRISVNATQDLVRQHLLTISETKANQLETFAVDRLRDVTALSRSSGLADPLAILIRRDLRDSKEYGVAQETCLAYLTSHAERHGQPGLAVFSPDGDLLLSVKEGIDVGPNLHKGPLRDSELAKVVDRARTLLQADMSDYQLYPGRSEPAAFVASPVFKDGILVGVVVLELDNQDVFRVLSTYSGLGETGEVLVGSRIGDDVVVVAPLRHQPDAAFKTRVAMGDHHGQAVQHAVRGQRGYGEQTDYRGRPTAAVWTYLPSFRWGMVIKQDTDEAFALATHQKLTIGILLGITVIGVVVTASLVARSLSRPVQAAVRVARSVAAGDLTAQLHVKAKGEIGELVESIQKMTDYLRSLIGKVQGSSVMLMSTATQIAATSKQQESAMNEYGASTSEAAAAVKEISATSQELSRTVHEVNDVAGHTAAMATAGQTGLAGMDKTMRQLVDSTGSINSKLSVISERAGKINVVVTTITKVADQTNLLSINAAIEAEKAGEYGRGFLVVAREIRRLADQTAVATLDIERMVKEMQQSVSAGVMEMDKFSEQVRQGVEEVGRLSSQLGQIITAVTSLTARFDQVNEGMSAQAQGAEQIREAMLRLSDGANQTLRSLCEFNRATDQMREAVCSLKADVSFFTVGHSANGSNGAPCLTEKEAVLLPPKA
jgi:methyl-accepting chemotaxis protein WspA